MKLLKKGSATVLAASMLLTCAAASACAHTHDYTEWKYNNTQHWKVCAADNEADATSYAEHIYVDGICDCGKQEGVSVPGDDEGPNAPTPGATHVVTFVTNNDQTYDPQSVSSGSTVLQPTGLTNGNKYIAGWYTTENFADGTQCNFAMAITKAVSYTPLTLPPICSV